MKKNITVATSSMLAAVVMASNVSLSMDSQNQQEEPTYVYSHGFGEDGPRSGGPTYPDAPGQFFKACFYTKPAVHVLANYLKKQVDAGTTSIYLEGRSCGAGTAINCLNKLINYDADYWKGSEIKSKNDADNVFNAINAGALDLTVPFLS